MTENVEELIAKAAATVAEAPHELEPWNYGWAYEAYRRSGRACLAGPSGSVTLDEDGLSAYETAMNQLLREPRNSQALGFQKNSGDWSHRWLSRRAILPTL